MKKKVIQNTSNILIITFNRHRNYCVKIFSTLPLSLVSLWIESSQGTTGLEQGTVSESTISVLVQAVNGRGWGLSGTLQRNLTLWRSHSCNRHC